MKKWSVILGVGIIGCLFSVTLHAQANELAQLALNIEKLAQFRQILSDLKKGYEILTGGYNTIKNLSERNFNLHKTFLDGLKQVSPAVKKYYRVADIVNCQLQMVREYKAALNRAHASAQFSEEEITYLSNVYKRLIDQSLENLDDLLTAITVSDLRMNDEERLQVIDTIYEDVTDKMHFLRSFNATTQVLALQRAKAAGEVTVVQQLYSLK